MSDVINFLFDGRDIIFDFAGLDIASAASDGSAFEPSMTPQGQGFSLVFDSGDTKIQEVNSQGELIFAPGVTLSVTGQILPATDSTAAIL